MEKNEKLDTQLTFKGKVFITGFFVDDDKLLDNFDKSLKQTEKKQFSASQKQEKKKVKLKKGFAFSEIDISRDKKTVINDNNQFDNQCIKFLRRKLDDNKQLNFPGNIAKRIVVNDSIIAIISKTRELYMTCSKEVLKNKFNLLCFENNVEQLNELDLIRIKSFSHVTEIAVGPNHCACIIEDGSCFLWGSNIAVNNKTIFGNTETINKPFNKFTAMKNMSEMLSRTGQIGIMDVDKSSIPIKLNFQLKVARVSVGEYFTILLTTRGKVYSFGGFNESGELGRKLNDKEERSIPNIVEGNIKNVSIVQISCGYFHTIARSNIGNIYSWGNNQWGNFY